MKDYLKEAIKNGKAIDCNAEPDKVKEIVERNLGLLRIDGDENWNNFIDKSIDSYVNGFMERGVFFLDDIELNVIRYVFKLLPEFMKKNIVKSKEEINKLKDIKYEK